VIADKTTPYRLLVEVLYTLGQSEYGRYHLMVIQAKSSG
jgi:biopolymer transport protein ExbD